MDSDAIAAVLGLDPGAAALSRLHSCPTCGRTTTPTRTGHPTLCLRCTENEIEESASELGERLFRHLSRNQAAKYPTDDDGSPVYPGLTYPQWHKLLRERGVDLR